MKEPFVIWSAALPRAVLSPVAEQFNREHKYPDRRYPDQSGFALSLFVDLLSKPLKPLIDRASEYYGTALQPAFNRSSCRRQTPDGIASLALHQDTVALGTNNPNTPCAVFWIPLCDIDDFTPSLEVCPVRQDRFVRHCQDESLYSVAEEDEGLPLVGITRMSLGDVLLMRSTTLHRSSVKPWHTKTRLSLDLRLLPVDFQ